MKKVGFFFRKTFHSLGKLNAADWFSIFRVIAAPVIVLLVFFDKRNWVSWLVLISFLTDKIDGTLARHLDMKTQRGATLDSRGDAMAFLAAATAAIWFEWNFFSNYWYWWTAALLLYLLQLILAYAKYGRPTSFHTWSAKIAAVVQAGFLTYTLFFEPVKTLFFIAIFISLLETLEEIILIFHFRSWQSDIKGLFWVMRGDYINREKDQ